MWIFFYFIQCLYFCIAGGAFNPRKGTRPPFQTTIWDIILGGGGFLYQFYLRSFGTIRENLQWGNPQATDTEMKLALRDAAAHFVFDKPEQLDSRCGEMGDGLSEGQAQRIAIARALLQKAPILLLDEATSSLDPETESMVLKNIVSHHTTQTIILITHRPEALKYCQQTLRLK